MPATVISGDAAALEDAFAEAVVAARTHDPLARLTVLAGHVLLKQYLPRMLAGRGLALLDVRFVTADELAAGLAATPTRPALSRAVQRYVARRVAGGARGYFAPVAGRAGLSHALLRLVRDVELGGFASAAEFERALIGTMPEGNVAKFRELARMYGEYRDRTAAFESAGERLRNADASRFDGTLLVYGVWAGLRELHVALVERVARARDVVVFLPRFDEAAGSSTDGLRSRLAAAGATERTLDRPNARRPAPADRTPSAPAARDASEATVDLISAPDTVREVWEAARACLRWAAEGVRFHDMAVVYRHADPYRALADEIFAEAGIGTYLHDGRLLSQHPLGRRLLALLDLAADASFSRQRVMDFVVETELPAATRRAFEGGNAADWDSFSREAGIVAGIEQWETRLARLATEKRERARTDDFEWLARVADRVEALRGFAARLHTDLALRTDDGTWDEHLAYLRRLADTYAAGLTPLLDALADLNVLTAVAPRVSFEEFAAAVRDDLESRDTTHVLGGPGRAFGRRGVAVLDGTSVRQLGFRAVCLVGVSERAWPPPPNQDPLLLDHERQAANGAGVGELPLRTQPDDEPLTFALAAAAAREHLTISYARSESGGSGKHVPSHFFRSVAERLAGRRLDLDELESSGFVRRIEAGRLAVRDLDGSLTDAEYDRGLVRAHLEGRRSGAIEALVGVSPAFGRAIDARRARWSQALTSFDGVLSDRRALDALAATGIGVDRPISPSRFEMYATCPYRYFLRHVLRIEPLDEPEQVERIDALERGSLIHEILERFLRECGREDPPGAEARSRHLARLAEIEREAERLREERGVTGRPFVWALDRRQMRDDLVRWYDDEVRSGRGSGLRPGAFEVAFGIAGDGFGMGDRELSRDAPLRLPVGDRTVAVQGRIDRVDWDAGRTRFRVIDYKTGRSRPKAAFDGGRAAQLPLYLLAGADLLSLPVDRGEAQYFFVTSAGGYRRVSLTGAELVARREELGLVITTVVDGISAGYFAQNPGKARTNCRSCDYRAVCDQGVERIAGRKAEDARGDAYRVMAAIP